MSGDTGRFQAAVIDGRSITVRFRQRQLTKLHEATQEAEADLVESTCEDSTCSKTEAQIQHLFTLEAIKRYYSEIDFEKCLEDEYSIAHSKDNLTRRSPYGYAYVVPGSRQLLYSTIVATAAAIAAGNCIALELGQTTSRLSARLRSLLGGALDNEILLIVDKDSFTPDFKSKYCISLDLRPSAGAISTSKAIATPLARTAAIVDRTADLSNAAKELVRARFSYGGGSPYAPDVVLVNEFCLQDLASAVAQHALHFLAGDINDHGSTTVNGHVPTTNVSRPQKSSSLKAQLDKDQSATTIASGSRGSVVLIRDRGSSILNPSSPDVKINEPILLLHSITSMDDAVDYLNRSSSPLLATYLFANPASAKYLSQFINASCSFTNHIPTELLVGPPAPDGFPTTTHPRFSPDMFSTPRPEAITVSPRSTLLGEALDHGTDLQKLSKGKKEKALLDVSLKPMKEPDGGAGPGFFEQGILTGGSILLSTIAAGLFVGIRYVAIPVVKKVWVLRG